MTPKTRQQYFLVLFQGGEIGDPLGDLNRYLFRTVQEKIDATIAHVREETEIDVWLESPGGDAHVAYKLYLELKSRASRFRVIVPDFAKSAATLFALGADELWMAPAAELGPLDAQVGHPDREGVRLSALDMTGAIDFLVSTATKHLLVDGGAVRKSTGLRRLDVLEKFAKFLADFFHPIMGKLDPHIVHQATNQLLVARRYANSMLKTRMKEEDTELNLEVDQFTQQLVQRYPSHGFVISRDSLISCGLPVKLAEEYNYWRQLKVLYAAFSQGDFAERTNDVISNHFIEVWSQDGFSKAFENLAQPTAKHKDTAQDENQDDNLPEKADEE